MRSEVGLIILKTNNIGHSAFVHRLFSVILTSILLLVAIPVLPNMSLDVSAAVYNGSNIISNNIHDHVYSGSSQVANSFLFNNNDGTFTRVENMGDIILVEKYNSSFRVISQATVPLELSKFGGFYSGASYNYLIFGQDNPSANNSQEVIRVVKYTKNWTRVGCCAVNNCNTLRPFDGGNLDFAEYGNFLYIRCSHITYQGTQGNLTISYKANTNTITDTQSVAVQTQGSFANTGAQYIDVTGGIITTVDDCKASPYAVTFSKYNTAAGNDIFRSTAATASCLGSVGAINGATSYFTVGGFESSSQSLLAVGTTTPLDGTAANRNVYVAVMPRSYVASNQVKISYMTGYATGSVNSCETPFLVKLSADRFMILWETRSGSSDLEKVSYVLIDGNGNKLSNVQSIDGCLSDCQPITYNGQVIWYTTNGANMKIYTVPVPAATTTTTGTVAASGQNVYQGVDYSAVYNFEYYCNRYPDIRVLFGNDPAAALRHFVNNGMAEGRQGNENFNVAIYKQNYADLRNLYGDNLKLYYLHYINCGYREGRNGRTVR